jgi:hypothetical protein
MITLAQCGGQYRLSGLEKESPCRIIPDTTVRIAALLMTYENRVIDSHPWMTSTIHSEVILPTGTDRLRIIESEICIPQTIGIAGSSFNSLKQAL